MTAIRGPLDKVETEAAEGGLGIWNYRSDSTCRYQAFSSQIATDKDEVEDKRDKMGHKREKEDKENKVAMRRDKGDSERETGMRCGQVAAGYLVMDKQSP